MILGATLVYIGLTWLFKCPEIEEVYGIAMRRPARQKAWQAPDGNF